jgi:hypothetical protein
MVTKKNLLLAFVFPILVSCQTEKSVTTKYPAHVGNISFDKKIDDANFKRCLDEKYSFQYYNFEGFQYKGEKIEIERKLQILNPIDKNKTNGYITIRFLVNCEGKTGMFRVQEMDENYKEIIFDKNFSNQLLDYTKNLDGWIIKKYQGNAVDYYQYLTYKITDGKVSEILP